MANKKTKKKNTQSKNNTKVESKSKKKSTSKKIEESKKIETMTSFDVDVMRIVRVVSIIVVVFCLFYFLTVFITRRDESTSNEERETEISFTNIMSGRSFSMPEEDYLVLFYEFENEDLVSSFSTAVTGYRSSEATHYPVYYANMSDAINKKYVSEVSNTTPADAADLLINGPTLIHFHEGKVSEYIEGESSIIEYLG